MGMINYFFVCFSLPDPKIKTKYVWAEHRKRKVALQKNKKNNKKQETKPKTWEQAPYCYQWNTDWKLQVLTY